MPEPSNAHTHGPAHPLFNKPNDHSDMQGMTILYLYSELGPYNIPVLRSLVDDYAADVHVVSWDRNRLKPYAPPQATGVTYYQRSHFNQTTLCSMITALSPDLIYVSGWMDRGYLTAARVARRAGTPVVVGFDDQWHGTVRQRVGALFFRVLFGGCFSHAWVAGPRQYEFAKRLGFTDQAILFDLLTCDYELFKGASSDFAQKAQSYPETFLYVGNFRQVKGTDILVKAFRRYRDEFGGKWNLICVGNGELRHLLAGHPDIVLLDFAAQEQLAQLAATAGAFVLPSRHDQWGVVVHEFAAAGLPLIISDSVGAASTFLIDRFNGVSVRSGSCDALCDAFVYVSGAGPSRLLTMSRNSRMLAAKISPEQSAASLLTAARQDRHQSK